MAVKVILFVCAVVVLSQNSFLSVSANPIGSDILESCNGLVKQGLNIGLNNDMYKKIFSIASKPIAFAGDTVKATTAIGGNVVSAVTDLGNARVKKHAKINAKEKGDVEVQETKHDDGNVKVIKGDGDVIVVDNNEHNNVVVVSRGPGSVSVVDAGGNKNFKYSSSSFSSVNPHGVTSTSFVGHSGKGGGIVSMSGHGVSVASGTAIASAGGKSAVGHPALQATKVFNDAHSILRHITSTANSMFCSGCGSGFLV